MLAFICNTSIKNETYSSNKHLKFALKRTNRPKNGLAPDDKN